MPRCRENYRRRIKRDRKGQLTRGLLRLQLSKIRPDPGDVLIVKVPERFGRLFSAQRAQLLASVRRIVPDERVEIMVVDGLDIELQKASP